GASSTSGSARRRSTCSVRRASSCGRARERGATSTGRASSSGRAPARSTPDLPRCSATSSRSASSACPRPDRSGGKGLWRSRHHALPRSSTRDYFTKDAPLERSRRIMEHDARGFEAPQWRQLAEMGYLGLTVPADQGGQGLGAVELAVVCEEAGRVCLPGPLLDTVVATALPARARGPAA